MKRKINLEGRDFIREKVRVRDGHRCRLCDRKWKSGKRFDVHHTDQKLDNPRGYRYDRKHLDKLITLCHYCHVGIIHPMLRERGRLTREVFDKIRISGKAQKDIVKWV